VLDNGVYGLTKGHVSPTTPEGERTITSPAGHGEPMADPLGIALAAGASWLARATAGNVRHLAEMIAAGVRHPGFALVHTSSPCPTYRGSEEYETYKTRARYLHLTDHDPTDRQAARREIESAEHIALGVLYHETRPVFSGR
jgi:2-oxoglutarate ferredoxin oxidoreductase subunit beta